MADATKYPGYVCYDQNMGESIDWTIERDQDTGHVILPYNGGQLRLIPSAEPDDQASYLDSPFIALQYDNEGNLQGFAVISFNSAAVLDILCNGLDAPVTYLELYKKILKGTISSKEHSTLIGRLKTTLREGKKDSSRNFNPTPVPKNGSLSEDADMITVENIEGLQAALGSWRFGGIELKDFVEKGDRPNEKRGRNPVTLQWKHPK